MAGPKQAETFVSGVVASVNDKGVKLQGAESWNNFSKFAQGLPEFEKGDQVTLRLQGDFIMGAKIGGAPDNGPRPSRQDDNGEREFEGAMERQGQPGRSGRSAPASEYSAKDSLIVRQVALKCAVEWFSTNADATVEDMLPVAQQMYEWVMRGE